MARVGFKRKLTVIIKADVAGCNLLNTENSFAGVKIIAVFREVTFYLIKQHRYRVVDSPGVIRPPNSQAGLMRFGLPAL